MRIHGQALRDDIGNESLARLPESGSEGHDILDFYEQNRHLQLDLDSSDAEETWGRIKTAFGERHTDYMQLFTDTVGEIASLPLHLAEGMVESPNPAVWAGSAIEGTGRALRDMWGLAAQSENPTSPLFRFKSAINALVNGKPSANWREEAQQWNDARRFLWHSGKIQEGDEVLLDQLTKLSDRDRETIKSFINPKIAHAMGYIGLEIPAILTSGLTGGAGTVAAIEAGSASLTAARRLAQANKVGGTLTGLTSKFENYASKLSQKMASSTATAVGNLLEGPATMVGNAIGGTTEAIAGRTGLSQAAVRNAGEASVLNLGREIGAGEVQATVGYLGSLGLRTISELAKEIGHQSSLSAMGVAEASTKTGLTVLERTALAPLSPSAQKAAKLLSWTVDPVIQLSTDALKASYKGGLEFAALGYLNDKDRGAVGGAAMGMVWSGYSGSVRHMWANVSGAHSHSIIRKNFDERVMPRIEKVNPEFATIIRTITADADKMGSTRVSANIRTALMIAANVSKDDLKNVIIHMGSDRSLVERLTAEGISPDLMQVERVIRATHGVDGSRAAFFSKPDAKGVNRPVIFINDHGKQGHRLADVSHEIMAHMTTHYMMLNGSAGELHHQFFGTKENGGVVPDKAIIDEASTIASIQYVNAHQSTVAAHYEQMTGVRAVDASGNLTKEFLGYLNQTTKDVREGFKVHFTDVLAGIRAQFPTMTDFAQGKLYNYVQGDSIVPFVHEFNVKNGGPKFGAQFIFEEIVGSRSEHLFMHTNLAEMTTPDEFMPLRMMLESKRDSMFASKVSHLEMAGIRAVKTEFYNPDGSPVFQTMAYDNGKFLRWPEMDSFIKSMMRKAANMDAQPVSKMSPQRQAVEARRFGKEFLFNASKGGMTMKGTKEVNETLNDRASQAFDILSNLDEQIRPEIITDELGNAKIDMTRLNVKAWDALVTAGVMDQATATYGKLIKDTINQWEASGFSTPNVLTGTYWGDSHEILRNGLLERLRGADVPITHRVFAPYEMELSMRTTDAAGRKLKNPRAGLTVTAIDLAVIHRRKIKAWSRSDVQALFTGIDHMNSTFDKYMINLMQEPSVRVTSEQLFHGEFGNRAAEVRNVCYEIFGAVKRGDESYINSPREGHENRRGPNFPINSFKLELMVELDRSPSTPFPYHHGRSYEPIRRNLSVAGFERQGKSERFINGNGYEIIKSGSKYKLFDPFGKLVDATETVERASRVAEKHLRKLDPADVMPSSSGEAFNKADSELSEAGYKDNDGMYNSNFGGQVMKSVMGYDEGGKPIKFTEELVDDYDTIKLAINSKDVRGQFNATLRDLMTPASRASLDKFNKSNGGHYDIGSMGIVPTFDFKGKKKGPQYSKTGRYYGLEFTDEQNTISLHLDMDYLESIPNKKTRLKLIKAAVDERTMALTQSMRGNLGTKSVLIHSIEGQPANTIGSDINVAEAYKRATSGEISTSQSDAKAAFATHVSWSSDQNAVSELFGGKKPAKMPQDVYQQFRNVHSSLSGDAAAKADFRTGVELMVRMANEVKEGDWGTGIGPDGGLVSFPSYADKNGKMKPIVDGLRRLSESGNQKGVEAVYKFGGSFLHGLFQMLEQETNADMGQLGRNTGNMAITFVDVMHESLNQAADYPVYIFTARGAGDIKRLNAIGHVIVVEKGANQFGGSLPQSEKSKGKFTQPTSFNKNKSRSDGLNNVSAFDGVIADLINGDHISDRSVMAGTPVHVVLSILLHSNRRLQDEVGVLLSKYESDNNRVALLEGLKDLAVNNDVSQAIIPAFGAIQLEKSYDNAFLAARFTGLKGYDPANPASVAAFHDRARREAKSHWNQSLSHYWAVRNNMTTNMHPAFESMYGMKVFRDFMSHEDIKRMERHVMQVAKTNGRYIDAVTNSSSMHQNVMHSIGDLESLRDKSRIDDLRTLGLVKTLYDRNGTAIHTFEFSDAEAGLNVEKNKNKTFLTPFIGTKNPEFAFENYKEDIAKGNVGADVGEPVTLGDVFTHDTLYYYYPELKSMRVEFYDGFGGQYSLNPRTGEEMIRIGARMFCTTELMRSMREKGSYLRSKESLLDSYASKNPPASVILHEIQHALQYKSQLMDRSIPLSFPQGNAIPAMFANLMGVRGNIVVDPAVAAARQASGGYMGMKYGRLMSGADYGRLAREQLKAEVEMYGIDGSSVLASVAKNESQVERVVRSITKSPVFTSLRAEAAPMLQRGTTMLAQFAAEYHERGLVPTRWAEKAIALSEQAKRRLTNDEILTLAVEFEGLVMNGPAIPEFGVHFIGDTELRVLKNAISMYSSLELISQDANMSHIGVMSSLRSAISKFTDTSYALNMGETMARETQRRAGMTNAELAANPRTDFGDFAFGSSLDLVYRAVESSPIIKSSELSKFMREHYDGKFGSVGVVMRSIAGISADSGDSKMVQAFGRAAIISFLASNANAELKKLGRFAIKGRGWEVGEDGKLVLSNKTYIVKGKLEKLKAKVNELGLAAKDEDHSNIEFNGLRSGAKSTYTIQDVARLADLVIEAEEGLSFGSRIMDAVLSETFPDAIVANDITAELLKYGVSAEDVKLYGIDRIQSTFTDTKLTKRDLANLVAAFHRNFEVSSVQGGEKGTLPSGKTIDIKAIGKEAAIRGVVGSALGKSALDHIIISSGDGSSPYSYNSSNEFRIGSYKFHNRSIEFTPQKPHWVPQEIFERMVKKHLEGSFHQNLRKMYFGTEGDAAATIVQELNRKLARKMLLIEPLLKKAIEFIESHKDTEYYAEAIASFMDDSMIAALEVAANQHTTASATDFGVPDRLSQRSRNRGSVNKAERDLILARTGTEKFRRTLGTIRVQEPTYLGDEQPLFVGTAWNGISFDVASADSANTSTTFLVDQMGGTISGSGARGIRESLNVKAREFDVKRSNYAGISAEELSQSDHALWRLADIKRDWDREASKISLPKIIVRAADSLLEQADSDKQDLSMHIEHLSMRLKDASLTDDQKKQIRLAIDKTTETMTSISRESELANKLMRLSDFMEVDERTDIIVGEKNRYGIRGTSGDTTNKLKTPIVGTQAFTVGGRTFFDLDTFYAPAGAETDVSVYNGGFSGVPLNLRTNAIGHSWAVDLHAPIFMNAVHDFIDGERQSTTPYDRYSKLSSRLKRIFEDSPSPSDSVYFSSSTMSDGGYLQYMLGGNTLAEAGLVSHAFSVGFKHAQFDANATLRAIGTEEVNRLFGDPNGPFSKAVLDVDTKYVRQEETGGVSVSSQVVGMMASPVLRLIAELGGLHRRTGGDMHAGKFEGMEGMLHDLVMEHAKNDDYSVPYEQIKPEAKRALENWVESIPESTLDRLALEMSSTDNADFIVASIGSTMAYQLAEKQLADPANFSATVRTSFVEGMSPNGLSMRNAVDLAITHDLHKRHYGTSALAEGNQGMKPSDLKVMRASLRDAVSKKGFWHGYFAAIKAHEEIQVPDLDLRPREAISGGDYVYRGTEQRTPEDRATHMTEINPDTSFINLSTVMSHVRFNPEAHGFNQAFSYYENPTSLHSRHQSKRNTIADIHHLVENPKRWLVVRRKTPISLSKAIEKLGSGVSSWSPLHLNGDTPIGQDGKISGLPSDSNGGLSKMKLLGMRTPEGVHIRRKLISAQLANMAAQMGTETLTSQAARYPASLRMPTVFVGLTAAERYEFAEDALRSAYYGRTADLSKPTGANDIPRMGVSWKKMSDGRIMINYAPDIDIQNLLDLSDDTRRKGQIGIPFRRAIGFDATSGTIIPAPYTRHAASLAALHFSSAVNSPHSKYLATLHSFDAEVQRHYGTAYRMLAKDNDVHGIELQNVEYASPQKAERLELLRRFIDSESDLYIPELDPTNSAEITGATTTKIVDLDGLISHQNRGMNGYYTMILPRGSTPEQIQAALMSIHGAMHEAQFTNGIFTYGTPLSGAKLFDTGYNLRDTLNDGKKKMIASVGSLGGKEVRLEDIVGTQSGSSSSGSGDVNRVFTSLRNLSINNPMMAADIVSAAQRILSSDSGYHVPEAERRLKLNGDREAIIKLMFPNRSDLLHYSWDRTTGGEGLTIMKRSGNAGYMVGHDIITGIDQNGVVQKTRKVVPFRTEAEANKYAEGLKKRSTEAMIPKELLGDESYQIEDLGQTKVMDAEVRQVMELTDGVADGKASFQAKDGVFKVGDIEKRMTRAEANVARKLLLTNDVVTGNAPKRDSVMLSTAGFDKGELERLVKSKVSFGFAGSLYKFSSSAMRALAYGPDRNKNFKEVMTGTQIFDLLKLHGVSKQEMRVTGLAQLLFTNKDRQMSRQEVAQYIAAVYPTFGRHQLQRLPADTGMRIGTVWSAEPIVERNVRGFVDYISTIERALDEKYESADEAAKPVIGEIRDTIRSSIKDSLAEVSSKAEADAIPSDKGMAEMFRLSVVDRNGKVRADGSSTMAILRNAIKKYATDKRISDALDVLGIKDSVDGLIEAEIGGGVEGDSMTSLQRQHGDRKVDSFGFATASGVQYEGYTSGVGAYAVHLLHGEVGGKSLKAISDYVDVMVKRVSEEADPEKKKTLEGILSSAKNVLEVRRILADEVRSRGHWSSPSQSMQFSHLRTSEGISFTQHPIGVPISELPPPSPTDANPIAISYVEELQSDAYQRKRFGVKSSKTYLPSDMKEAEQSWHIARLNELDKGIADTGILAANIKNHTNAYLQYHHQQADAIHAIGIKWRLDNSGPVLRHMLIDQAHASIRELLKHEHRQREYFEGLLNVTGEYKVPKAVTEKYGLPAVIPTYEINTQHELYKPFMKMVGHSVLAGYFDNYHEFGVEIYGADGYKAMNPNVSVSPEMVGGRFNNQRDILQKLLFNEICRDEDFAANLEKMREATDKNQFHGTHPYDYDALVGRVVASLEDRIRKSGKISSTTRAILNQSVMDLRALLKEDGRDFVSGVRNLASPEEWHIEDSFSSKRMFFFQREGYGSDDLSYSAKKLSNTTRQAKNSVRLNSVEGMHHVLEMTIGDAMRYDMEMHSQVQGITREQAINWYVKRFRDGMSNMPEETKNEKSQYLGELLRSEGRKLDTELLYEITKMDDSGDWEMDAFPWRHTRTIDPHYNVSSMEGFGDRAPLARQYQSRTMGGRLAEFVSDAVLMAYSGKSLREKLEVMKKERHELEKRTGITLDPEVDYSSSIPLGEDNAYRGMSVNALVMNALQGGKKGLAFADARHHRTRYGSSDYSVPAIVINGRHTPVWAASNLKTVIYAVNHANKTAAHGDFFAMIAKGQIAPESYTDVFEHNGVTGDIAAHAHAALKESFSDALSLGKDTEFAKYLEQLANTYKNTYNMYTVNKNLPYEESVKKYMMGSKNQLGGGSFDDGSLADVLKKIALHKAAGGIAISVPYEKMHGYAVNYGAPRWLNEITYSGQPEKSILNVSHDAFDVPAVSLEQDGTFSIKDKTGKVLAAGIKDIEMLNERRAQLSKYLGSVPLITAFMSQFGRTGAHVLHTSMFTGTRNRTTTTLNIDIQAETLDAYSRAGEEGGAVPHVDLTDEVGAAMDTNVLTGQGQYNTDRTLLEERGPAPTGVALFDNFQDTGARVNLGLTQMAIHAMGLRKGASETEIARAIHASSSFSSPLLKILPDYPTDSHAIEMRKMIAQGIPLMSTSGFGDNTSINAAKNTFRKFIMADLKRDYMDKSMSLARVAQLHNTTPSHVSRIADTMNWGHRKWKWVKGRKVQRGNDE